MNRAMMRMIPGRVEAFADFILTFRDGLASIPVYMQTNRLTVPSGDSLGRFPGFVYFAA